METSTTQQDTSSKIKIPKEKMTCILCTDVGSTTTKARLFEKREEGWRYVTSGEAPTTVEAPYQNVILGVQNAIREIEELTGQVILTSTSEIITPIISGRGIDMFCTTSSAGGGLQMVVAGVVSTMTAESAHRAALGAGAIVMDVIAIDDGRPEFAKINRLRSLRPDMIVLAGGTDGGTIKLVMEIAEVIKSAKPLPRFGVGYKLPLIFAGNKDARQEIKKLLEHEFTLSIVDNIRPTLGQEVIEPTRREIHEIFMQHVMSHAPGYQLLSDWASIPVLPTPAGEGMAIQLIAKYTKTNVIGVGLGGATTNVYSVFEGKFARSVSANLGMSYSICNVLKEAGVKNVIRWIPFPTEQADLENRLFNKMTRPTTIPQTLEDLIVEHAIAREALRLGLAHHKTIARRLKGVTLRRDIGDIFDQSMEDTYIKMTNFETIVGTGGLLSHAPRRSQSAMILADAFQPEGITTLLQDSVFMMPHLGVLSTVNPEAAWHIFERDCLIKLGTIVAPRGVTKDGHPVMEFAMKTDGNAISELINFGQIKKIPLTDSMTAEVTISPAKEFDVGAGSGKRLIRTVSGGVLGIILDCRGRPISLPENTSEKNKKLLEWFSSIQAYPSL